MTQRAFYLPDLCSPRAALGLVLIVELTALVLTLARADAAAGFWTDLACTSTFLLWIGLAGASLLCALREHLGRLTVRQGSLLVALAVCGVVAVVSEAAVLAGRSELIAAAGAAMLFPRAGGAFLVRNEVIALIVTALALRYYYVSHEWRRTIEMQARARVHALQARIRPHFLFNSMNTIAALTRSDPASAEQAVQDLADLFRASLNERRDTITLEEEVEIARTYERVEQLRLGARLEVRWSIGQLPRAALVPSLMLQPLLENAIYHGIEPRPDGGTVTVSGELADGLITIVVRNPAPDREPARQGNGLALANVRERLALLYGERALVKAGRFDAEYIVTMRFPHVESAARLIA
jgi:two-component system, LytTR family, sensor histidine kinase AlgZ